ISKGCPSPWSGTAQASALGLAYSLRTHSTGCAALLRDAASDFNDCRRRAGARLAIDIGPQFRRVGLGIMLGEIGGGVDDVADLGVDRLQVLLADLGCQQAVGYLLDRVLVVANL